MVGVKPVKLLATAAAYYDGLETTLSQAVIWTATITSI